MLHFHIITLFPESIEPYLNASILRRAQERKKISVHYYNPRDYTSDKHLRVDRKPYGGGPGMVLEPESLLRAAHAAIGRKKNVEVLFFSPSGKQFDTALAKYYARDKKAPKHIVCICGRYEGVDARVAHILKARPISVGPYVLTGGELPAALIIDAIARYIPGVLGDGNSLEDERKTTHRQGQQDTMIAHADVYTKPEILTWRGKKYRVPEVLLSGDHKRIEEWKKQQNKLDA